MVWVAPVIDGFPTITLGTSPSEPKKVFVWNGSAWVPVR